jgi:hypothetical protein
MRCFAFGPEVIYFAATWRFTIATEVMERFTHFREIVCPFPISRLFALTMMVKINPPLGIDSLEAG